MHGKLLMTVFTPVTYHMVAGKSAGKAVVLSYQAEKPWERNHPGLFYRKNELKVAPANKDLGRFSETVGFRR